MFCEVCVGMCRQSKLFTTIAYNVTIMTSKEDVQLLFEVLGGKRDVSEALLLCPQSTALENYVNSGCHKPNSWKICSNWAEWWLRD